MDTAVTDATAKVTESWKLPQLVCFRIPKRWL